MDFGGKVSNQLWRDGIIPKDEMEIVQYGINQILSLLLNILTLFCICVICGTVVQGIVFLVLFWPMRIYAGGYHANTRLLCYMFTTLAEIILVLIWSMDWKLSGFSTEMILLVSQVVILMFAPQDNSNKRIDVVERENYRRKVINVLIIQDAIFCISFYIGVGKIFSTIICLQALMAVLLVIGKRKSK